MPAMPATPAILKGHKLATSVLSSALRVKDSEQPYIVSILCHIQQNSSSAHHRRGKSIPESCLDRRTMDKAVKVASAVVPLNVDQDP